MYFNNDFAVVIPMANEESDFQSLMDVIVPVLDRLKCGTVYFVIDKASRDNTLVLCQDRSEIDERFKTIWAPENKNVVDAYIRGYREAYNNGHTIILEMDAGLSHDPRAIPMFLRVLNEGNDCAFGSRFVNGGSIWQSSAKRTALSKVGTLMANWMLGTRMYDMTSGYQGFHRDIVGQFLNYQLLSKAHFYQTELRYLLRNTKYIEVPIHYRAPSPSVSKGAITNSLQVLWFYFKQRLFFKARSL